MADRSIPPILLVRLKSRMPDGAVVGESERVCHLVPVPQAGEVPDVLRAYCGKEITPGSADLLDRMSGMPCEPCLARSPIPAFAMLRPAPPMATSADHHRDEVGAWWDLGLQPDQKITARFVLLLLSQDPPRDLSVAEIALWLGQDAHMVNLIMLLHAAVGWVQPSAESAESADRPWADRHYQLTERGRPLACRLLARGLTATFTVLATRLGLDTTVISGSDPSDPGGRGGSPDAAPIGPHHEANDRACNPFEDPET